MKELLKQVNELPGVLGSMVMTEDGLPVTSLLGPGLDEDCVAAYASNSNLAIRRAVTHFGDASPDEIVLESEGGNLLLKQIDGATLAVITHPGLEMNTGMVEIRSIAKRLHKTIELGNK